MVTEVRTAPRVAPPADSLAASAARHRGTASIAEALSNWGTDGVTPFGPSPEDAGHEALKQARAFAVVLECAWRDSRALYSLNGGDSAMSTLNGEFHAQAMNGLSSLINLGILMLEDPS